MPSAGTLLCLASAAAFGAMGIFGKLAYDEGATRRHAAGRPLRARRRAVLAGRGLPRARRATCARSRAATSASPSRSAPSATAPRPAATSPRSSASTRRCSRCSSTRSPRSSRWPRSRSGASGRAGARPLALALASTGLVLVLAGAAAGRAGPARRGARARRGGRLQRLHPHLGGRRRAHRPARAEHAGLHRRGDDADARRPRRAATSTSGGVSAAGLRLAGRPRRRLDGRRRRPVLRRAAARRARRPRRSSRRSSRWSPSCSRSLVFGESLGPVQLAGGALVLLAVLAVRAPCASPLPSQLPAGA